MIAGGHFGNGLLRMNMKAHVGSNIPEIKIINLCHQISIRKAHVLIKLFLKLYNSTTLCTIVFLVIGNW